MTYEEVRQLSKEELYNYFFGLAMRAKEAAASVGIPNIDARWIVAQWYHETQGFTSALFRENMNCGGVTQVEPNGEDNHQPDGGYYYIVFDSYEAYADYFGTYLEGFKDSNIQLAETLQEYLRALKDSPSGAYFGDSYENYLNGTENGLVEIFGYTLP